MTRYISLTIDSKVSVQAVEFSKILYVICIEIGRDAQRQKKSQEISLILHTLNSESSDSIRLTL